MISRFSARTVIIVLAMAVVACVSQPRRLQLYEGPPRPDSEVAELRVPGVIDVVTLDGKDVDAPYVGESDYFLALLPGAHRLGAMYKASWGDPTSSALVVSDVFEFQFEAQPGAHYVLRQDGPSDLVTASRFADPPVLWMEDAATGRRIQAVDKRPYRGPVMRLLTASTPPADAAGKTGAPSATAAEQVVMEQDALARLKFWWRVADQDARDAFKQWLQRGAPGE